MVRLLTAALLSVLVILPTGAPARAADATPNVISASDAGVVYLCQKKDRYGCWQTVYVCYCYADACSWYNNQPSNARIIAQK